MRGLFAAAAFAAAVSIAGVPSLAQTPAPAATAPSTGVPVAVTDPFVVSWVGNSMLTCMTFSNASDRVIAVIRFGLRATAQGPSGAVNSSTYLDRVGSFAPGVAIRPPSKFLGTVNHDSPALQNCFVTYPAKVNTLLQISVLRVQYADGTVWENPYPSTPQATASY